MSARALCAILLGGLLLAGCAPSEEEVRADYCETVADRQGELSEIMARRGPDTLLRALPVFRDLADQAPRDLADDWARVVEALGGLDRALAAAGVEPAAYDADRPPPGVTGPQRRAIALAADELARPEVAAALEAVRTHALDVCKTPLYR